MKNLKQSVSNVLKMFPLFQPFFSPILFLGGGVHWCQMIRYMLMKVGGRQKEIKERERDKWDEKWYPKIASDEMKDKANVSVEKELSWDKCGSVQILQL